MKHNFQPIRFFKALSKNLVIKGTLILTIAGFTTRIIGFYNRIFLSGLIGATQLGIYQLIFPLYMVAFSITTYGNELALTKLVSEYDQGGFRHTVLAFFRICFLSNLVLSVIIATFMFHNAQWLSIHILHSPECEKCLQVISLGIPFMAMKGAIHGYFLGIKKSGVHGLSDLLEQLAKVLGLYLLSTYFIIRNSYDASFAVWGIVMGEIISFLYSLFAFLHHMKTTNYDNMKDTPPLYPGKIRKLFISNALPLTTNRLALTVLQSMESILIPSALLLYYSSSTKSLSTYGIFSGMAFPFIMFPSTITNSLSTMLLPEVSSAKYSLKSNYLKHLTEQSIHFCLIIGVFSTVTFYIFGPAIANLFFHNKEAGIFLHQLSFLCPLIYLSTTMASVLNGLGYATHNLAFTVFATVIRICFINILIPKIGMTGYIFGLFAGYLFQVFAILHKIETILPIKLYFMKSILIPGSYFSILGTTLFLLFENEQKNIPTIILLPAILIFFTGIALAPFFTRIYLQKSATT